MREIEVSMEQHRNKRAGETRENPPTNSIVRHDSHMRKSGVTRPGIELGTAVMGGEQANRSATVAPKRLADILHLHHWPGSTPDDFEIEYRPGNLHSNADAPSRRPCDPFCRHCECQEEKNGESLKAQRARIKVILSCDGSPT
ncbi:hypothetical protein PR048_025574 [Dryococelus australis]|uniref:Uncharacterized protein n=1 Tax=Dryococelus australis TaxID=614101 RepID=A0ABQ9GRS2_9NEOP|nr:hypothetical protein PR048_025574 [Dryococelus australis]